MKDEHPQYQHSTHHNCQVFYLTIWLYQLNILLHLLHLNPWSFLTLIPAFIQMEDKTEENFPSITKNLNWSQELKKESLCTNWQLNMMLAYNNSWYCKDESKLMKFTAISDSGTCSSSHKTFQKLGLDLLLLIKQKGTIVTPVSGPMCVSQANVFHESLGIIITITFILWAGTLEAKFTKSTKTWVIIHYVRYKYTVL